MCDLKKGREYETYFTLEMHRSIITHMQMQREEKRFN